MSMGVMYTHNCELFVRKSQKSIKNKNKTVKEENTMARVCLAVATLFSPGVCVAHSKMPTTFVRFQEEKHEKLWNTGTLNNKTGGDARAYRMFSRALKSQLTPPFEPFVLRHHYLCRMRHRIHVNHTLAGFRRSVYCNNCRKKKTGGRWPMITLEYRSC